MSKAQGKAKLSTPTSQYLPWIVWGLGCVFYFYEFLLQVSPGVMSHELMHDFSLTGQALGILAGAYYYSYAAMQIPVGVLMDRYGPHRLLTIATLICAISTIAFGMTDNFTTAYLARIILGFGSAFAVVGVLKLAANWFPAQKFAFLTGLMVTIGMLGAIGGEAPLALLIESFGWRNSMEILGILGLFLTLLILLIAKDSPEKSVNEVTHSPKEAIIPNLLTLIKSKQLWLVAIYGGLMYMSTPVFCGLWGVPFLMLKMNLSKPVAANCISLIFVGWAIAGPLWGLLSNRIGKRKPPMIYGAVGALICSGLFIYASNLSTLTLQILLLSFGIFSAGFLPAFSMAKELCNQHSVATGLSFMNMMNMIGIALIQPLIGFFLDQHWQGTIVNTTRVYPLEAYYIGLSLLPLGIFVALLILPFIKETNCQNVYD